MQKRELRAAMRAARRALPQQEQKRAAQAVLARIRTFEPYMRAQSVMAYAACRGELSLAPVMEDALSCGKTLLLPRCEAAGVMTARRVAEMGQLVPGAYGLMEPDASCEIAPPEEIDLILVPGTAFDRHGGRIGQGGGYYDRFLLRSRAVRAGVCHDFALLDAVPAEEHDIRMDAVIAPQAIFYTGDSGRNRRE